MRLSLFAIAALILGTFGVVFSTGSVVQAQATCGTDYQFRQQNGFVIMEVESVAPMGDWTLRTDLGNFTGDGYYRWEGSDSFGSIPASSVMRYSFYIEDPGRYQVRIRNHILTPDNTTEHNDVWARFTDADEYYGEQNGERVYPRDNGRGPGGVDQTPYPEGASTDGYLKLYDNRGTGWSWNTRTSDNNGWDVFAEFDNPGVYELLLAGRSNGFSIDRVMLFDPAVYPEDIASSEVRPETGCADVTNPFTIAESNPVDGNQDFPPNRDITLSFTELPAPTGNWFNLVCPPTQVLIDTTNSTVTTDSFGFTYTIAPADGLPNGYNCTLTLDTNLLRDTTGSSLSGSNTIDFKVRGDPGPIVTDTVPADGAGGIATNTNIALTFSEPVTIDQTRNWFEINCDPSGTRIRPDDAATTGSGANYTINPNADLIDGDTCTVTFPARGAITDSAGTSLRTEGITEFSFTIGGEADPTAEPTTEPGDPTAEPTTEPTTGIERIAPADGQALTSTGDYVSRFQWRDIGAEWYAVYVSEPDFVPFFQFQWYAASDVCNNGICTTSLDVWVVGSGEFAWWMTYWSQGDGGAFQDRWQGSTFSIEFPAPGDLNGLTGTANVTGDGVTVQWDAEPDTLWYNVWVGPDDFSGNIFFGWQNAAEICTNRTCTLEIPGAAPAGDYQVWLQAWNPVGIQDWTRVLSFTVTP